MNDFEKLFSRRRFLKQLIATGGIAFLPSIHANKNAAVKTVKRTSPEIQSEIFRSVNGSPEENIIKVVEMLGGIDHIIGQNDVVLIKPNLQWWSQGAPNLAAVARFIDLIMNRPGGFKGEVIIGENVHRGNEPWKAYYCGWVHPFDLNSDLDNITNMNDLARLLKNKYGDRLSICHLINVSAGGARIYRPEEAPGYIYCDGTNGIPLLSINNGLQGDNFRATIMTYPIMRTDLGTIVDFKNGIWKAGEYTDQPLRFINFCAVNHHSSYCGFTSAIKNYMGISDLSGGPDPFNDGKLTTDYYNFHSFPFNNWSAGPEPGMLGYEMGEFMRLIRKADLNIATAEWIGLVSRTEPPVAHTRTVLASSDPVALDYHSAKYILNPNSNIWFHHPDDSDGPFWQTLLTCAATGAGILKEEFVKIHSYDHKIKRLQTDDELEIKSDIIWGNRLKQLFKYLLYRFHLD